MTCSCNVDPIAFRVPSRLREFSPDRSTYLTICPRCLTLTPVDDAPDEASFSRIVDAFPDGDAGVAMALAVGLLVDSLTMHRDDIAELFDRVASSGTDPWLVLERLAGTPTVDPDVDLGRRRRQLEQLLDRDSV